MSAEWRSVVGYEGLYEVSDDGRVRGLTIQRERRLTVNKFGYILVQLWKNNRYQVFMVHRIVAAAFIGPLPAGKEVNHIDGDKSNLITPDENGRDRRFIYGHQLRRKVVA